MRRDPLVDVFYYPKGIVRVIVGLPGVGENDIKLEVSPPSDGILIKTKKPSIVYEKFIPLNIKNLDLEKIAKRFHNHVLELTLIKEEEGAKKP